MMKAEIVVTLAGITEGELLDALQSLRNLERRDPKRIGMFIMVGAQELSAEQTKELLGKVNPPLPYVETISGSSVVAGSRWN